MASTSDSKVISTSPWLRCKKVAVASRPPLASTGTLRYSLPTNSAACAALPPLSSTAPALGQHGRVAVRLADELGRLRRTAALVEHLAPGRQIGIAAIAAGLGVDHDHLHAR